MHAAHAAHAGKFKETISALPLKEKADTVAVLTDAQRSRLKEVRAGAEGKD